MCQESFYAIKTNYPFERDSYFSIKQTGKLRLFTTLRYWAVDTGLEPKQSGAGVHMLSHPAHRSRWPCHSRFAVGAEGMPSLQL